ncbi:uncharacterized protein LOC119283573 [Triticum dicoccoides]|uniref:uncharacterized protein LOC119283573 n=1 Tax=Triticum dicoccoides TaxID=85692 RepID=UPI00188E8505|nr:uncharacterized protein LOC119283573 [Triticum dicoccoides]
MGWLHPYPNPAGAIPNSWVCTTRFLKHLWADSPGTAKSTVSSESGLSGALKRTWVALTTYAWCDTGFDNQLVIQEAATVGLRSLELLVPSPSSAAPSKAPQQHQQPFKEISDQAVSMFRKVTSTLDCIGHARFRRVLERVAATSAVGVALGVRLLLLLSRSRALKPLATTTSAAAAALRAPRLLAAASSPLAALLAASKAASKSYKAARALDPAARLPSLPSSKRVKAAFAAASLLRLAPTLLLLPAAAASPSSSSSSPTALFALALLKSGYKLSKNSAKVVEGFLGLQVHKGFRNGVDALGVVVKVAVIASEVVVWVAVIASEVAVAASVLGLAEDWIALKKTRDPIAFLACLCVGQLCQKRT